MKHVVVGITGASGAVYGRRLVEKLAAGNCRVHVIVSPAGLGLLSLELGIERLTPEVLGGAHADRVCLHRHDDLMDALASGSTATDGMAVCPCSSNTLSAIAAGLGDNLITRAAHVHLKQRRGLVLVPREMPVSAIDLENQLRLARAGAIIAPACPGFYLRPTSLDDLVEFMVCRVADCLGIALPCEGRYRELD